MLQSGGFPTVSYAFCVGKIATTTKLDPFLMLMGVLPWELVQYF